MNLATQAKQFSVNTLTTTIFHPSTFTSDSEDLSISGFVDGNTIYLNITFDKIEVQSLAQKESAFPNDVTVLYTPDDLDTWNILKNGAIDLSHTLVDTYDTLGGTDAFSIDTTIYSGDDIKLLEFEDDVLVYDYLEANGELWDY